MPAGTLSASASPISDAKEPYFWRERVLFQMQESSISDAKEPYFWCLRALSVWRAQSRGECVKGSPMSNEKEPYFRSKRALFLTQTSPISDGNEPYQYRKRKVSSVLRAALFLTQKSHIYDTKEPYFWWKRAFSIYKVQSLKCLEGNTCLQVLFPTPTSPVFWRKRTLFLTQKSPISKSWWVSEGQHVPTRPIPASIMYLLKSPPYSHVTY